MGWKFFKDGRIYRNFGGYSEHGNEILSKFEIINARNHHYYKEYSYYEDWSNWKMEDEPRSVIVADIMAENKKLRVINVHGHHTDDRMGGERELRQCEFILSLADVDVPVIIAGDFNLLPDSPGIRLIAIRDSGIFAMD